MGLRDDFPVHDAMQIRKTDLCCVLARGPFPARLKRKSAQIAFATGRRSPHINADLRRKLEAIL